MFGFKTRIDEEIERIQWLMDHFAYDFDAIERAGKRGSLSLSEGKRSVSVALRKESGESGGQRCRESISLGTINSKIALEHAKQDYLAKLNKILKQNSKALQALSKHYLPYDIDSILDSVSAAAKAIISNAGGYHCLFDSESDPRERHSKIVVPGSAQTSASLAGGFGYGGARDPKQFSTTASGRQVRSKGEVIIDIALDHFGVPHDYEQRIELFDENGFKVYRVPDFTLFCAEKLFWEHFGMLDNDDYLFAAAKKIQLYNRNGIVLWKNLIVTVDGPGGTVDAEAITRIIKEFVLPRMPH